MKRPAIVVVTTAALFFMLVGALAHTSTRTSYANSPVVPQPPNIITVINTNDSGAGSLRQAITEATPGDTIDFAGTGTITLTSGELVIDKNLTLQGPGANSLVISGNHTSRVFSIAANATVSIEGLTITNGYVTGENAVGGGVSNGGALTLSNVTVSGNTSANSISGGGGGIYNAGTLNVVNSSVSGNNASSSGGTPNLLPGGSIFSISAGGGGIANVGALTLTGSQINSNSVTVPANPLGSTAVGGGLFSYVGTVTVTNCSLNNNTTNATGASGGAIYNYNSSMKLMSSTISGNLSAGIDSAGGGIVNGVNATMTLEKSTISDNTAQSTGSITNSRAIGGGIYTTGTLTVTNSTISANSITGSVAFDTPRWSGGTGIYNDGAELTITGGTITGNFGTINKSAGGGGILNRSVSFNSNAYCLLRNTIVAGNLDNGSPSDIAIDPVSSDSSYNLIGTGGAGGLVGGLNFNRTDIANPGLGPLANNGGPTQTHALLPGSPAIDQGNSFGLTFDQRGLARAQDDPSIFNAGDGTDIGAFEVEQASPDGDGDGINDDVDNCPDVPNPDQANFDGDTLGDACDPDDDNDGVIDTQDAFPHDRNESVDTDGDGIGNNADADDDGDDQSDADETACGSDPLNTASKAEDHDGDHNPDCVDADDDNDGVSDSEDAFPFDPQEWADTDGDGVGNNADPDDDNDGQSDADEIACNSDPLSASSKSTDFDNDNRPDCVDPDDDNDGVADANDAFPNDPNEWVDTDGDHIGNNADTDDDNDGDADATDCAPLNAAAHHGAAEVTDGIDNDCDGKIDETVPTISLAVVDAIYNGQPHGGTATASGAGGLNQSLVVIYSGRNGTIYPASVAPPTNAGDYTASATFAGDATHDGNEGSADYRILRANALIVVMPYNVTYDGQPHAATGTATGAGGTPLGGLDLNGTTHTDAGNYASDSWTFMDVTGNYNNASGTVNDQISRATSDVTVNCPASETYTGSAIEPCTARVTSAGNLDEPLAVSYADNTDAGSATASATYEGDANHEGRIGVGGFSIKKAPSTTLIAFETGPYIYRGAAFTATAAATGAGSLNAPVPVIYGGDCTNVTAAGCTATATYPGDANHEGSTDSKSITILKAAASIIVNGFTGTYDGHAHGAAGSANGVGGEDLMSLLNLGPSFTNVPGGTAHWTFIGNANYAPAQGDAIISISKADQTIVWSDPAAIVYGTPLSPLQLNAAVSGVPGDSAPGAATYAPAASVVLHAGTPQPLVVNVASTNNYNAASRTVYIDVQKAVPVINWITPAAIIYGTPIGATQLNATAAHPNDGGPLMGASLAGTFAYTPLTGAVLPVGNNTLSVLFTPSNTNDYKTATKTVIQRVNYGICVLYDQTKAAKSGSTIPIKLQLCNASGANLSSSGLILTAIGTRLISPNAWGGVEDAGNANPEMNFRFTMFDPSTGGYIFNLQTKGLATGVYQLGFIAGNDPTIYTVQFQIR